ncbi:hypothetical protein MIR68_009611 [Amoeboaphelidium protococcarum]|nr:hypothetical protein MIR68_009611 [Amoeboaphelidium protococcarum]
MVVAEIAAQSQKTQLNKVVISVQKCEGKSGSFVEKLVTKMSFSKDDVVASFKETCTLTKEKRYSSVQIGRDSHIELNSDLVYMNHSCDPNVKVDVKAMNVVALRDLPVGSELTFFYPSTEWAMAQPFDCWCGYSRCLKKIQGAEHLETEQLMDYYINDHILEMLNERDSISC